MAIQDEAGPSSGIHIDMSRARMDARDIASGNTSITGQHNNVYHYHGISGTLKLVLFLSKTYQMPEGSSNVAKVVSWLSPHTVDYLPAHDRARLQRTPKTGKWFFKTSAYKMWIARHGAKCRNLECVGIPGSGKTTMASAVIADLQAKFLVKWGFSIVLYAYFRHDMQSSQAITTVLASLLIQVIKQKRKVSSCLWKLYEEYSSCSSLTPALDKLIAVLRSELAGFWRTYIIIDALDEYSVADYSSSHSLVVYLQQLNAKLLITSRFAVGFTQNTYSTLRVSAHADDIQLFVQKQLTAHLATIVADSPGLLEEIVSVIVTKSDGMFIVARLLVGCFPHSMTANEIRDTLKDLPSGIKGTYEMAMTRVRNQEPHLAQLGIQALSWVYLSQRPLTVEELRHALSFRRGIKTISEDNLIGEDRILSSCAGLITVVKDSEGRGECQLAHFTTREFLDECWRDYFPMADRLITETCLEYLAVSVSAVTPERASSLPGLGISDEDHQWRQQWTNSFAFCSYAATYWGHHSKAVDEEFDLKVGLSFFQHPISPYLVDRDRAKVWPTTTMLPMHFWELYFARFGLLKHLQYISALTSSQHPPTINRDHPINPGIALNHDIRDGYGWTALHLSAYHNHPKIVEFLLDKGNNPDADVLDTWKKTPLHWAAGNGHHGVVKILLSRGSNANAQDQNGWTPLFIAAEKGHVAVVTALLEGGADVDLPDNSGRSPSALAVSNEIHDLLVASSGKSTKCSIYSATPSFREDSDVLYEESEMWMMAAPSITAHPSEVPLPFPRFNAQTSAVDEVQSASSLDELPRS